MTHVQCRPARNGVDVSTLFATVDAVRENRPLTDFRFRAHNTWINGTHNRTTIQGPYGAGQQDTSRTEPFVFEADHPAALVGSGQGVTPVESLMHAIASCRTPGLANIAVEQSRRRSAVYDVLTNSTDVVIDVAVSALGDER